MTHPYSSKIYAESFGKDYEPLYMENVGTYVLIRKIPGTSYFDAMGTYPLTFINKNANFSDDFKKMKERGVVSLVGVADPFFSPELSVMKENFGHVAEFKEHFLHDFSLNSEYSKHHRYEVRRASKLCETKIILLKDNIKDWYFLYKNLIEKHKIKGVQAFSENYFKKISELKTTTVAAYVNEKMVSAHIWFEHEGFVYSHLAASDETGYKLRAAYAIYDASINYFRKNGAKVIDLGGGAGEKDASKGLTFLKKGFSNKTATCYIFGEVLDRKIYDELSKGKKSNYFPLYRTP